MGLQFQHMGGRGKRIKLQGQLELCREFLASLGYTMKSCLTGAGAWTKGGGRNDRLLPELSLSHSVAFFLTAHTETQETHRWSRETTQR